MIERVANLPLDSVQMYTLRCVAMEPMTKSDIIALIRIRQGEKTQREFADEMGISQQYLCDVLAERRDPGPAILEFLGIEKVYVQNVEQQ